MIARTVTVDVKAMFAGFEPWDVCNSVANLGPRAGELTWSNAESIALDHKTWLRTPVREAVASVVQDARETGAWDAAELAAWRAKDCLAYLAQTIASDMRLLGSDDRELDELLAVQEETDWDSEPEYPRSYLYYDGDTLLADIYLGV